RRRHTRCYRDWSSDVCSPISAAGEARRAARLFGASEVLREEMGRPLPPSNRSRYDRDVASARREMADAAFAEAWQEGRSMPLQRSEERRGGKRCRIGVAVGV